MKKVIYFLLFFVILLGISYLFKDQISEFIYSSFKDGIKVSTLEPNEYYRPVSYSYVQITDDFEKAVNNSIIGKTVIEIIVSQSKIINSFFVIKVRNSFNQNG